MNRQKLQAQIEAAIRKADTNYFFEDYAKQAKSVMQVLDASGCVLVPKELPAEIYVQAANEMRTGRLKPEEHVKDVYQVLVRLAALK